ncbi:c-type cytochrome [Flavobacterium chungnamense]|uniref:C-type cytochrome n=1 Tax=Flavobacterium chungnamense TaxID=706182 RepID=A0ABP7URJ8_9FLAO
MKTILKPLTLLVALFIVSCGGDKKTDKFGNPVSDEKENVEAVKPEVSEFPLAEKGKEIFEGKGTCATCHKLDIKLVGPSIQDIAEIYKEKNANMITFLKGEGKPIVDPTQYEVMKANFALTKTFSDEELESLEQYIYSQEK